MHLSSLQNMQKFVEEFLSNSYDQPIKILDLGSTEMGACYRPIFEKKNWHYIGADLSPGPNVSLILNTPYSWHEIPSGSIDVLISGQVLEHVEYFWITMLEIARVLRPGGIACLIAPSSGPEHRYPVDCWRFYNDGMVSLGRFARLDRLKTYTSWDDMGDPGSDLWHDSVGVYRKPNRSWVKHCSIRLLQYMQHRFLTIGLINAGSSV